MIGAPPRPAARPARPDRRTSRTIVVNAASIVGTFGVTSALGAVFWWLAAHRFAPDEIGRASAIVSAMTLLSGLSSLGLGTLLIGELRRQRDPGVLVGSALAVAGVAGAGLAFAYVFSIPFAIRDLRPLVSGPATVGVFVAGVAAIAVGNALDGALVGLLKAQLRLLRNLLLGVGKLAFLVLFAFGLTGRSNLAIYAAWTAGAILALVVPAVALRFAGGPPLSQLRPRRKAIPGFRRAIGEHQIMNLGLNVPSLVLPSLVIGILSARANAGFYVAWMIASLAFIVPPALTQILFAVAADDSRSLAGEARLTMGLCLACGVASVAVVWVAASPLLQLFGSSYAHSATWMLRAVVVAVLPLSVKDHYVALARIRNRLRQALPLIWLGASAELGLAALGAQLHGLDGLGVGWLTAMALEAAAMAWPVRRMLRGEVR
ncbi:MAG TPA: hypothetical protein VF186_04065 [Gaiellaceae bacterium]